MKLKKILIISGAVLVAAGIAGFTIVRAQSGYTKVLTAKVVRQNLVSIVSGTGQIKPKTYVNIGATSFGRITHLYVKEGDHVKKGQVLATVESVQAKAGVDAQQASIRSADTDIASYLAAEKTAEATVDALRGRSESEASGLAACAGPVQGGADRKVGVRLQEGGLRHRRRHPGTKQGGPGASPRADGVRAG